MVLKSSNRALTRKAISQLTELPLTTCSEGFKVLESLGLICRLKQKGKTRDRQYWYCPDATPADEEE